MVKLKVLQFLIVTSSLGYKMIIKLYVFFLVPLFTILSQYVPHVVWFNKNYKNYHKFQHIQSLMPFASTDDLKGFLINIIF